MSHFLIGLWCAMRNRFYMTTSYDQCPVWTKKKLQSTCQSQTCTKKKKKVLVTVWWSATRLVYYSFLYPCETINIWEVCSANRWDAPKTAMPAASIGQQKGSNSSQQQRPTTWHIRDTAQGERIVLQSFASSTIFTGSLANWLPLLQASQQLFAGKMLPQPGGCRKCFPRVHRILKHGFLCYKSKQIYFSSATMCGL